MVDLERVESVAQFVEVAAACLRKWQKKWDPRTE